MSQEQFDVASDDILSRPISPQPAAKRRYAAVYVQKNDQGFHSMEAQYRANREQAAREGYEIPDDARFHYSDDMSDVLVHRAGFDRLLKEIASGESPFERVYVTDRITFGRWEDPRRYHFYEMLFNECGVRLRYSNEADVELSSTSGIEALVGIVVDWLPHTVRASEEREALIRRMRGGVRRRVLDGLYPGPDGPVWRGAVSGTERRLARPQEGVVATGLTDRGEPGPGRTPAKSDAVFTDTEEQTR